MEEKLRQVMRNYPQGVSILACLFKNKPVGMTISSLVSLSLRPPSILVSIMRDNLMDKIFSKVKYFSINILGFDQAYLSRKFSQINDVEARFESVKYTIHRLGPPIIENCLAELICESSKKYVVFDHLLIVGKVHEAEVMNLKYPLVYYMKDYTTVKEKKES